MSDCSPPFASEMGSCVTKAENKETGLIGSKCAEDCPECYADGDCSAFAIAEVASVEAEIDAMMPLIYCDDSASADALNEFEARCQDILAKTLPRFAFEKLACLRKCREDERWFLENRGIPLGMCDPPAWDCTDTTEWCHTARTLCTPCHGQGDDPD